MRAYENPFRVGRVEGVAFRPQGMGWSALEERLERLGYRAAIVGPEGSGKTTLLRELGRRVEASGRGTRWIQLTRDRRRVSREDGERATRDLSGNEVILFDGAGHLPLPWWWVWRWRLRRAGGLIITAHRGRRLPVLLRTSTSAALLGSVMEELLDGEGGGVREALPDAEALHRRHGGNVRTALRELYDRCAALPGKE